MAVIIPNAGDTTGGNKYESLDQAEPDALDFEILGNAYTGVLSGCEVTSNASPSNVAVASGTIVLNGVPYIVAANGTLALPPAPSDNRFDLIVARVASGIASLTVVSGDDSGTNPSFPRSVNLIDGDGSPTTNIFPDTDVVLAAVYRSGSNTVTSSRIVDKRAIRNAGIMFQGSGSPTVGSGTGKGQFYFDTADQNGTTSGVYVQRTDGTWVSLAADVGAHFPIGGVFAWPVNVPAPVGCIEANGQGESKTSLPALFSVYGYTFGGSGDTFNVPNLNDGYSLKGTTTGALVGTTTGSDTVTLATANLPIHSHSMNNHSHTLSHTHDIGHGHSGTAVSGGSHSHSINHDHGPFSTGMGGLHNHAASVTNYVNWVAFGGTGNLGLVSGGTGQPMNLFAPTVQTSNEQHEHIINVPNYSGTSGPEGSHSHSLSINSFSGNSGPASSSTTSGATGNTGNTGSGTAFSNVSKSTYVKWLIRASLGDDPSYTGGTPVFEAAYQEVFVVELYSEGETVAADTSLGTSFRMPWPGTITGLRAATGVASDSGPIIIDVNEEAGSLLSTKLTIDQGELSSTTAATPPVISDTLLADDSLITFDVDNGGANAEGPLTVTLYITRSA